MLTPTSLAKLLRTTELPPASRAAWNQIRLSRAVAGYRILSGSAEQLEAYAVNHGMPLPQLSDGQGMTHGLTAFAGKTIYLSLPSKETLIHELIHAGTFELLLAVKLGHETNPELAATITRLKALRDQFLGLDVPDVDQATGLAYRDAMIAILEWQDDPAKPAELRDAAALSEFMAWGLANKHLAAVQQRIPAKLVQLSKEASARIKALFFPKARMPGQAGDMLSQLQFNTAIILRAQAKLQQHTAGEVVLS